MKKRITKTIGYFPGAFKPPHIGHYNAVKHASKVCDQVVIVLSEAPRDQITGEMALQVWQAYIIEFSNVKIELLKGSPVSYVYDKIEEINNSEQASSYSIKLFGDKNDYDRWKNIEKYSENIGKITYINTPRVVSARELRDALSSGNDGFVSQYLPSHVDKDFILGILKSNVTLAPIDSAVASNNYNGVNSSHYVNSPPGGQNA